MPLVSGGIRFVRIFAEIPRGGSVKRQWGSRGRQFSAFSLVIFFGYFTVEASLIIWRYAVGRRLSETPKCMTSNDLDWLFRVKFCFRAGLAG